MPTSLRNVCFDAADPYRRDDEIERLRALGVTFVGDHRNPDGTGWAIRA